VVNGVNVCAIYSCGEEKKSVHSRSPGGVRETQHWRGDKGGTERVRGTAKKSQKRGEKVRKEQKLCRGCWGLRGLVSEGGKMGGEAGKKAEDPERWKEGYELAKETERFNGG